MILMVFYVGQKVVFDINSNPLEIINLVESWCTQSHPVFLPNKIVKHEHCAAH